MNVAVTGASGFIGRRLTERLQREGHQVRAVSLRDGVQADQLAGCGAVVNLGGEPVAQRWTAAARARIRASRIEGTRALVEAMRGQAPQVLISASAIGYYGSRGDEILTENSAPAQDFLGQVCADWEREARAASDLGVRVCCLRIGVVLGPGGGALAKMLLPFRLGLGGPLAGGRQYMSWIHRDDLIGLMLAALDDEGWTGPINATAPEPVTNRDFARALGRVLGRPSLMPVPGVALRLLYGEMSEILTTGARVLPAKPLVLGYQFRQPSLAGALQSAIARE